VFYSTVIGSTNYFFKKQPKIYVYAHIFSDFFNIFCNGSKSQHLGFGVNDKVILFIHGCIVTHVDNIKQLYYNR
jgi:hypothetical protein